MPLDPRISLGVGSPPNLLQAISGAEQIRQSRRQAPLLEALQQQKIDAGTAARNAQQAQIIGQYADALRQLPVEQRAEAAQAAIPLLERAGIDQMEIRRILPDLTDDRLDAIRGTAQAVAGAGGQGADVRGTPVLFREGEDFTFKQVNERGKVISSEPISGTPVSVAQSGQTPAEQTARKLEEERGVQDIRTESKIGLEKVLNTVRAEGKTLEGLAAGRVTRIENSINAGMDAVERLPTIERGLALIERVNTGGLTALSKDVTDFFGTTSGDVGELNRILGQNVLAGLANFKGAISDSERRFVEKLETGLRQGRAFNRADLKRAARMLRRQIAIAREAAAFSNDDFALEILNGKYDVGTFAAPQGGGQRLRYNPETGQIE